jgi:HlyD family secretion protein
MKIYFFVLILLLSGCEQRTVLTWPGYVEAEYTHVASPVAGRLIGLPVARGVMVAPGQALFTLEKDSEQAGVDEASARLRQSEATARDLGKGKRADEIQVVIAQLESVRASLRQTEDDLKRQRALAASGFTSGANLEAIAEQGKRDQARVAELEAQVRVARLAAREDTRTAAQDEIAAGRALLDQAKWKLDQKTVNSLVAANVEDTLYRVGEWVPAGSPVVSLSTPEGIKIRFFVPQTVLASVAVGGAIRVSCDACGSPISARISFIANSAEFTPPVLYSKDNRAKLVYMIEAHADAIDARRLRPGQPIEVELAGAIGGSAK